MSWRLSETDPGCFKGNRRGLMTCWSALGSTFCDKTEIMASRATRWCLCSISSRIFSRTGCRGGFACSRTVWRSEGWLGRSYGEHELHNWSGVRPRNRDNFKNSGQRWIRWPSNGEPHATAVSGWLTGFDSCDRIEKIEVGILKNANGSESKSEGTCQTAPDMLWLWRETLDLRW
jgi:hypothetical protein